VDCFDKATECLDDNEEKRILHGKKKPTSVRMVTTMQAKHNCRKGCVMFEVHISSDKGKYVEDAKIFKRYPLLQQYQDVFSAEIPKLPSHMEVDFSIESVPGVALTSKAPYKTSTLELIELKLHLKDMLDNGYIRPSVSP